jgi:hypothetical protein
MITQDDFFGVEHVIEPCSLHDIEPHYELVKDNVVSKCNYTRRMKQCIEAGTAYKIDDEAFIYFQFYFEDKLADAFCIYGGSQLPTLLMGVFNQIHTACFTLRMGPHKPGWHKDIRSILRKSCLEQKAPLVCRLDELMVRYAKFERCPTWES